MTDAGASPGPPERPAAQLWSRTRLLNVATQVASVVFAVLVALAIDEWWEGRENAELGRRGLQAITAEVRSNLEQLEERRDTLQQRLVAIDSGVAQLKRGSQNANININYPVALLSSAAWQSAQVTRAVSFIDIDRVIRIARVYDTQAFFLRNQDRLTDMIADMASTVDNDDPATAVANLGQRYRLTVGFVEMLALAYRCLLHRLEGSGEPPPDCGES